MTELVAELEVYKKLDDRKQVKKTSESEGIGPRSRESECSRTDRVLRPAYSDTLLYSYITAFDDNKSFAFAVY